MKKIRSLFIALSALCLLTGCIFGNGEGYGFKKENVPSSSDLVAQFYYDFSIGYQCTNEAGEKVPSYRRMIVLGNNSATLYGDRCTGNWEPLSLSSLKLSMSRTLLVYEGVVFESAVNPSDQMAAGPRIVGHCMAGDFQELTLSKTSGGYGAAIFTMAQSEAAAYQKISFGGLLRQKTTDKDAFIAPYFSLEVDTRATAGISGYPGKMRWSPPHGDKYEWEMTCFGFLAPASED